MSGRCAISSRLCPLRVFLSLVMICLGARRIFLDLLSPEVREGLEFSFIEGNDEGNAIEEMELMSACKHAIIANSTFSWWAAYRIANPHKIVIAPKRITIDQDEAREKVFYPPHWVLLEV